MILEFGISQAIIWLSIKMFSVKINHKNYILLSLWPIIKSGTSRPVEVVMFSEGFNLKEIGCGLAGCRSYAKSNDRMFTRLIYFFL